MVIMAWKNGGSEQLPAHPRLHQSQISPYGWNVPSFSPPPHHPTSHLSHTQNCVRGAVFSHDGHSPLHQGHSNHKGIFGTDVVGDAHAVVHFLHFFHAIITITSPSSPSHPPPLLDGRHFPTPNSSWSVQNSTPAPHSDRDASITYLTPPPH